jgi:serine/threonine protein kinase
MRGIAQTSIKGRPVSEPGILPNPIPFGKYYLLERINVGGMAEVYKAKAFGVEGFERLLAVKKILSSIAEDESFINMFIDEAKIAGQLNHPNIAQIFDLGKVDGSYFIALEYIGGKDLKTIFERARRLGEKVSIPRICYVMMKTCEGLAHAHHKKDANGRELNIVHRDVSPQNILISYEGEVKIIDFGIAKAQGKSSTTQVGILKGKFSYMSPEQVRGLHVDNRSDIFSLGIVLYELLTLERLFLGESDFDTLEKIRKVEMSPPSLYNPHIPKELEDIVLKALAKSPEDRFQTAYEFAEALERFMRNQGFYYTNKDLASYMKEAFSADIEFENKKLEYYKSLNLQPLEAEEKPNGASGGPMGSGLSWGEEEMETQIFDREDEDEELEVDEADIVYAEPPAEEDLETIEDKRWEEEQQNDGFAFDDDPLDRALKPDRKKQPTAQVPSVEPRREFRSTMQGEAAVRGRDRSQSWMVVVGIAILVVAVGFGLIWMFAVPHTAPVTFETQPKTVQIWVNGELKHDGPTPFEIDLEPGPTQFELKRDGYISFKTSRDIVAGKAYNLTQHLEPEGSRGRALLVKTDPPGASITINGKTFDEVTPSTIEEPGSGPWKLIVQKEGFFTEERPLDTIPPSGVAIRLRPKQIAIKLTSDPERSEYEILEKESDEKVASGRTPDTVKELDASKVYRVEIRRRDYEKWSDDVEPGFEPEIKIDAELAKRETVVSPPVAVRPDPPKRNDTPDRGSSSSNDTDEKRDEKKPDPKPEEKPKPTGTGVLTIGSKPTARVYIDGQDTGRYTPLMNFKVKAGKHKINLVNPEFGLNKTYYVDIKPGDSKKIINK